MYKSEAFIRKFYLELQSLKKRNKQKFKAIITLLTKWNLGKSILYNQSYDVREIRIVT